MRASGAANSRQVPAGADQRAAAPKAARRRCVGSARGLCPPPWHPPPPPQGDPRQAHRQRRWCCPRSGCAPPRRRGWCRRSPCAPPGRSLRTAREQHVRENGKTDGRPSSKEGRGTLRATRAVAAGKKRPPPGAAGSAQHQAQTAAARPATSSKKPACPTSGMPCQGSSLAGGEAGRHALPRHHPPFCWSLSVTAAW